MSSEKLFPTEISEDLLTKTVPNVIITTSDAEFHATVSDLREALRPLGLELTCGPVNWTKEYPGHERAKARLIELELEATELRDHLDERNDALEGTFPQAPGRKAAE